MSDFTEGELMAMGAMLQPLHPRLSAKCFALGNEAGHRRRAQDKED